MGERLTETEARKVLEIQYEWPGERMFKWHSKEAKIIRAFVLLESRYRWMDEYFEKAINLRDNALGIMKGVEIEITDAFMDRMHRYKRAACRLRDRLGCSNRAASPAGLSLDQTNALNSQRNGSEEPCCKLNVVSMLPSTFWQRVVHLEL